MRFKKGEGRIHSSRLPSGRLKHTQEGSESRPLHGEPCTGGQVGAGRRTGALLPSKSRQGNRLAFSPRGFVQGSECSRSSRLTAPRIWAFAWLLQMPNISLFMCSERNTLHFSYAVSIFLWFCNWYFKHEHFWGLFSALMQHKDLLFLRIQPLAEWMLWIMVGFLFPLKYAVFYLYLELCFKVKFISELCRCFRSTSQWTPKQSTTNCLSSVE